MYRVYFYLILVFVFGLSQPVYADQKSLLAKCISPIFQYLVGTDLHPGSLNKLFAEKGYDKMRPLKRTETPLDGKAKIAGKQATSKTELANLKDGDYVYLVTKNHGVFYSPRDLDKITDKELVVAHTSLYNMLKKQFPDSDDIHVIGAGEFQMKNRQLAFVANQSGTWRSKRRSLRASLVALEHYGLPVDKKTPLIDMGKPDSQMTKIERRKRKIVTKGHANVYKIAKSKQAIKNDPELASLKAQYIRLERELLKKYALKSMPTYLDTIKIDKVLKENPDVFDLDDRSVIYFYLNLINEDGIDPALIQFTEQEGDFNHLFFKEFLEKSRELMKF